MELLLVILLVLFLVGGIGSGPWMPYAKTWGWGGTSVGFILFIILLIILLRGGF